MKNSFHTLMKSAWALLFALTLLYSCNNESRPAQEAPAEESPAAAPAGSLQIDFEHFGAYDLSTWEIIPLETAADEGDMEVSSARYQQAGLVMVVDTFQSEYYYIITHNLKNSEGEVQKIRSLEFRNDTRELVETVNDYTLNPPRKFTRKQAFEQSWQQLSELPSGASGEWTESAADELEE